MVSRIEPDRYANTGFSVKDTPTDINDALFHQMMKKSGAERLVMGMEMQATARALVWSSIPNEMPEDDRRREFYSRFFGEPCPW